MSVHICIVSAQLLANYIPIKMECPDHVHIISSSKMQADGLTTRFKRMLDSQNIPYTVHENMPDFSMNEIHEYAVNLYEEIKNKTPSAQLTLNITGGNKLMMLGLLEMLKDDVHQIIYTDTSHDLIEFVHNRTYKKLTSVLDVPQYLSAYGANYKKAVSADEQWLQAIKKRKKATKYLAENALELDSFISTLNALVNNALSDDGKSLDDPTQIFNSSPKGKWREALKILVDSHILTWNQDKTINFLSVETARYAGGIWLEEYVYHIASDAKPDDVRSSVEITWDSSKNTKNELDLLVVHNNRMLVIECKTLNFGKSSEKNSAALYKIDSLGSNLTGLFGEKWLVTAREPTEDMKNRAKSQKVNIISPSELKRLREKITNWMEKKDIKP